MPSWSSKFLPNSPSTPTFFSQSHPASTSRLGSIHDSSADLPTLRGVAPSTSNLTEDQLAAPGQSRRSSRHGRSVSHPLTAIFGGGGKRAERQSDDFDELDSSSSVPASNGADLAAGIQPMQLSRLGSSRKNAPPQNDKDFVTGNCATCDSTVRWPKHLDVYRCTVCFMVNDLKPGGVKKDKSDSGQTWAEKAGDSFSAHKIPRKAPTLSLDRTRGLIDQCLATYLREKAEHRLQNPLRSPKSPLGPQPITRNDGSAELQSFEASKPVSDSPTNYLEEVDSYFPHDGPSPQVTPVSAGPTLIQDTGESGDQRQQGGKYIFRQLENYLLACMSDCDCLNTSFGFGRPTPPVRAASEASALAERPKMSDLMGPTVEEPLFEVDAKTLLLGDIGENGMWWTGDRRPSRKVKEGEGNHSGERRYLRLDLNAINHWFEAILSSGKNWRNLRRQLPDELRAALEWPEEERVMEQRIGEGRYHVQRTFLKSIENLLRRPGRPIKDADDCRFLLILMLNPLLYPHFSRRSTTPLAETHARAPSGSQPDYLQRHASFSSPRRSGSVARGGATGLHSGILKRILGLISNSSIDCHQSIIPWLTRLPDSLFRDVVEMINGFVTYRLSRSNGRHRSNSHDPTAGLIPNISGPGAGTSAQLHAALGVSRGSSTKQSNPSDVTYGHDWQIRAAAKVMALVFSANNHTRVPRPEPGQKNLPDQVQIAARQRAHRHAQRMPTNSFYNSLLDTVDLVADFEAWEMRSSKFSFCQYPMFISIWAKIRIMEHDARRQMEVKARDAFFTSIMSRKAVSQYLVLKVRRDCLVEDSLTSVSEVVGTGQEEIKKGLRIEFVGEEGVDAGGLRKEWFLLLVREVFDPDHGLFVYDEESNYCYFNSNSFETSDQFFLVGVVLGLAIYNSTILDVALPPFAFRKLLSSAPPHSGPVTSTARPVASHSLDDLAEWKPSLAKGLRQLLEHVGDVESTLCRNFTIDVERYGSVTEIPLCPNGENRPVTNANRREFVDAYIKYLLDDGVARQYEPFKRGFFTVCGGNALSLFRPEEIELLIRGSDEPLDVGALRAVAVHESYVKRGPGSASTRKSEEDGSGPEMVALWFWDVLGSLDSKAQRKVLAFITGSDRIPAMGPASLVIKVALLDGDSRRYPTARTCFNQIGLYPYRSREELSARLMGAVGMSEGFGLK